MDANPILSAAMGGRAGKVFLAGRFSFFTVGPVLAEVEEYLPVLAEKKGLNLAAMRAVLAMLPLAVVPAEEYSSQVEEARDLIAERDPDDVPLLALALALGCPIWTNDSDFKGIPNVAVYTTAELLAEL